VKRAACCSTLASGHYVPSDSFVLLVGLVVRR
jgi:hypothetical protein